MRRREEARKRDPEWRAEERERLVERVNELRDEQPAQTTDVIGWDLYDKPYVKRKGAPSTYPNRDAAVARLKAHDDETASLEAEAVAA